jgi:hypothetical protein
MLVACGGCCLSRRSVFDNARGDGIRMTNFPETREGRFRGPALFAPIPLATGSARAEARPTAHWRARCATADAGLTKIIIEFESPPPK